MKCRRCHGIGFLFYPDEEYEVTCSECNGEGEVKQMEGFVVRIIPKKSYGFIRDMGGKEYFFHKDDFQGDYNTLEIEVNTGKKIKVTFESVPSQKGLRAGSVAYAY